MNWGSEKCIHPEFQKVSVTGLRRGDRFLQSYFDSNAFSGLVVVLDYPACQQCFKEGLLIKSST